MNIEQAQEIFAEIIELCYQTENPRLIELATPIYQEVQLANDISNIIRSAEELQVILNEIDMLPDEEETAMDIQELIEKLSE